MENVPLHGPEERTAQAGKTRVDLSAARRADWSGDRRLENGAISAKKLVIHIDDTS